MSHKKEFAQWSLDESFDHLKGDHPQNLSVEEAIRLGRDGSEIYADDNPIKKTQVREISKASKKEKLEIKEGSVVILRPLSLRSKNQIFKSDDTFLVEAVYGQAGHLNVDLFNQRTGLRVIKLAKSEVKIYKDENFGPTT